MNRSAGTWTAGLACLAAFLLAGCGTSPPVRYFSLEPMYQEIVNDGVTRPMVGIGEIRTPSFRYRSQLVTRGSGGEMIAHDFLRWSEPLDQAMHRVVAANVDSLLAGMTVFSFPYDSGRMPAYKVQGSLDRFDVDTSGLGVLIVQWGITDSDDDVVVPIGRSRYESRSGSPGDPASDVATLNELLAAFSRDIAAHLQDGDATGE
jgi:uncharacterized lipoprotein YmbA